jgi:hypothetical protein
LVATGQRRQPNADEEGPAGRHLEAELLLSAQRQWVGEGPEVRVLAVDAFGRHIVREPGLECRILQVVAVDFEILDDQRVGNFKPVAIRGWCTAATPALRAPAWM